MGIQLDPEVLAEAEAPPAPRIPILTRRPHVAVLADLREPILGLDTVESLPEEQRAIPFWEIATLFDLASLLSGKAMLKGELLSQIEFLRGLVGELDAREKQLLRKYEHLADKPENLATGWKETKIANGAGGKFRWQAKVEPLTLEDEAEAAEAGLVTYEQKTVTVTKFDVKAARAYIAEHGAAPGVKAGIAPPPLSYTPRPTAAAAVATTDIAPTPAAETQDQVAA